MDEQMVDAIEDGRLVRVTESYAKSEGLFVLKRPPVVVSQKPSPGLSYQEKMNIEHGPKRKSVLDMDRFRKPLKHDKNTLYNDLKENFHWDIIKARKARNLTRRQVANSIGVNEDEIKMMENGVLSSGNYVLLNKVEKFFNINLRRGSVNYQDSMRKAVDVPVAPVVKKEEVKVEAKVEERADSKEDGNYIDDLIGGDIELKD